MKAQEATAPLRAVTREEIEIYRRDGVVCLRGVLSGESVKAIEDAIETAMASLDRSFGGYNLTKIVDAIASDDQATLKAASGKQYNVEALGQAIKASGKPPLVDGASEGMSTTTSAATSVPKRAANSVANPAPSPWPATTKGGRSLACSSSVRSSPAAASGS